MTENNARVEYNLDKNSDSEGYKNEDIGDNESIVPDSDPNSSDIEVSSVGLVKFLMIILILGMNWMTMDLTPLMMLLSLPMQSFLTGQLTSLKYQFSPLLRILVPINLKTDVSLATALDYFNLLFKPEIFSDIEDHTNNYAIFKQEEIWRN